MAKQREEAMQQQALESNEQVAKMNADTAQAKNDVEIYKADKDYDKVIDAKLLDLGSNVDTAEPAKEVKDTTNLDNHKMNMDKEDLNLAKQKFQQDKKEGNQKILESKAKVVQLRKPTPSK